MTAAVENFPSIDIRRLARSGLVQPGGEACLTRRSRAILVEAGDEALEVDLHFLAGDELRRCHVHLTETECHFGGTRIWFRCPRCGRRVAILYLRSDKFACRHCHRLTHSSRNEDAFTRALRRAFNVRERLGGDGNLQTPFPEKPRGMHARTYERWRRAGLGAEQRALRGMSDRLAQIKKRCA